MHSGVQGRGSESTGARKVLTQCLSPLSTVRYLGLTEKPPRMSEET